MSILLTSDELATAYSYDNPHRVAHAQIKKVAEWGREACVEHLSPMGGLPIQRHGCEMCWQSLREEYESLT